MPSGTTISTGVRVSHDAPVTEPTSHRCAVSTCQICPRVSRYAVSEVRNHVRATPTSTSRVVPRPPFQASRYMITAVAPAPSAAAAGTPMSASHAPHESAKAMASTAAVDAPAVMPSMSGVASGLRATVCILAPATARPPSANAAIRTIGSCPSTMALRGSRPPPPNSALVTTSAGSVPM